MKIFSHTQKRLKIHQANIIKRTKKSYKRGFIKGIKTYPKKKKKKKKQYDRE